MCFLLNSRMLHIKTNNIVQHLFLTSNGEFRIANSFIHEYENFRNCDCCTYWQIKYQWKRLRTKWQILEMDCDSNGVISDSITHVGYRPDNIEPFLSVTFFQRKTNRRCMSRERHLSEYGVVDYSIYFAESITPLNNR